MMGWPDLMVSKYDNQSIGYQAEMSGALSNPKRLANVKMVFTREIQITIHG